MSTLQSNGFHVRTASVASKKPTGTVLAQSPQSGARVARGSTVTIHVSRGLVTVPDTVGQSRTNAIAAVRGAGLKPTAFVVPSSQPKGNVVAQAAEALNLSTATIRSSSR